jgi:hypothetical protein
MVTPRYNIHGEGKTQSYSGRNPASGYSPKRRKIRRLNRFAQGAQDFGRDVGQMGSDIGIPGVAGAAMAGAKNIHRNQVMHDQNRDYFGGNLLHDKIPNKVRESLMTPRDESFYDKYMKLASLGGDREQEYLKTANQAKRNAQITGRLNFGLGQIDPEGEYLNKEGLPSYSQDLFGEGYNRFNMDKFKEAMGMGEGILGGLSPDDVHPEVIDNYNKETFNIHGDEGITPDPVISLGFDPEGFTNPITETDLSMGNLPFHSKRSMFPHDNETVMPGIMDPMPVQNDLESGMNVKQFDPLPEKQFDSLPTVPEEFNDNLREAGIMSQHGLGPRYANNSMKYLDEYKNALASGEFGYDTERGMVDYDEFVEDYERLMDEFSEKHSLPRGLHLGE